jgi:hypothetical protein
LRGDPFVPALAFRCRLDPGGAEIVGVAQPLYQAEGIELADHPGKHRRIEALEFGEFGQAQRPAADRYAEHGRLGRSQPLLPGSGVKLPRQTEDNAPQADD